jgi:uncharacterized protein (UPF0297 family)
MAKKIIEEIVNATTEAHWNLCKQLIGYCISKEPNISW